MPNWLYKSTFTAVYRTPRVYCWWILRQGISGENDPLITEVGPISPTILHHNFKFDGCHGRVITVPCAKLCCYPIHTIWMRVKSTAWWRHQMETFSPLLGLCVGNSPVTDDFPTQRPVTRSFEVFFDLRMNQQLSKHCSRRWFETSSRHYDVTVMEYGSRWKYVQWNGPIEMIWHSRLVNVFASAHGCTRHFFNENWYTLTSIRRYCAI